jgi:uncharacterized protein YijF (DUF1287 family)
MNKFLPLLLLLYFFNDSYGSCSKVGEENISEQLLKAAQSQIGQTVSYNPAYKTIAYPNGDVPLKEGVCTDVIIRSLRTLGIDLQARIHRDMNKNWAKYPKKWGLKKPDSNIDHRRVPNIACYFRSCKLTATDNNYQSGDIVIWDLGGGIQHIGFVSDKKAFGRNHFLVVHNIGRGVQEEDILYHFKIIDHFRIEKRF